MKKNKKIKILAFGKQGMKAAKHTISNDNVEIFYIDNNKDDFEKLGIPNKNRILVDFSYEINSFRGLLDLNETFKRMEVRHRIEEFVKNDTSLICFMFGLGGKMSMLAKEILSFLEKRSLPVPILAIASMPLRYELRNYTCNVLTNRMLSFFEKECHNNVGFSLVDMELIFRKLEYDLFKTIDNSCYWISRSMNELINWVEVHKEWEKEQPEEYRHFLKSIFKGLVYFSMYESKNEESISADTLKNERNSFHTYCPNPKSDNIIFTYETKEGFLYEAYDLYFSLCEIFPDKEEFMKGYWVHKENLDVNYRAFIVSSGIELTHRRVRRDFLYKQFHSM